MAETLPTEEDLAWMRDFGNDLHKQAAAKIRELRDNQRLRGWKCPCGDLVFRDTHYDLECGTCQRVQVDADEFLLDVEIHKLRLEEQADRVLVSQFRDKVDQLGKLIRELHADNAKLREYAAHLGTCGAILTTEECSGELCTCGLEDLLAGKDHK